VLRTGNLPETTPRVITKTRFRCYSLEKGAIIASINSEKFTGRQSSAITVTIDKPAYAKVRLHVKVLAAARHRTILAARPPGGRHGVMAARRLRRWQLREAAISL